MPLVLGRGHFWDISVPLEPLEMSVLIKVREAGPSGYLIKPSEILYAQSLYYRNMIKEADTPWRYVLGRGWS